MDQYQKTGFTTTDVPGQHQYPISLALHQIAPNKIHYQYQGHTKHTISNPVFLAFPTSMPFRSQPGGIQFCQRCPWTFLWLFLYRFLLPWLSIDHCIILKQICFAPKHCRSSWKLGFAMFCLKPLAIRFGFQSIVVTHSKQKVSKWNFHEIPP